MEHYALKIWSQIGFVSKEVGKIQNFDLLHDSIIGNIGIVSKDRFYTGMDWIDF